FWLKVCADDALSGITYWLDHKVFFAVFFICFNYSLAARHALCFIFTDTSICSSGNSRTLRSLTPPVTELAFLATPSADDLTTLEEEATLEEATALEAVEALATTPPVIANAVAQKPALIGTKTLRLRTL
ncbi:hypothetical protein HMPREF1583_01126, partial [Gardnerella vaginalis JCP8151B]